MYIDIIPNRKSPRAILLRESIRQGKQVQKRTIANLSHWAPERIQAMKRTLRGDFDHLPEGTPTNGPVFGLLYVLKTIADQTGITAALGSKGTGKLQLFLTLARVGHQGSRLSAVRWAHDQAVAEVLGLSPFQEEDLYAALDDLAQKQETIERKLYRHEIQKKGQAPVLFLYDITSSYLEGEHNELAEYGYNRDGKRGKKQIVIGLLTNETGEPLSVQVFQGNTTDCTTVVEQVDRIQKQFQAQEVVFVGDRGMIKWKGKEELSKRLFHYITALTDPQIRKLMQRNGIHYGLFEEKVCEVEADGKRYILRRNADEARKQQRREEDKLRKLRQRIEKRNALVQESSRCQPEAGLRTLQAWVKHHQLSAYVHLQLQDRQLEMEIDEEARQESHRLDGCYVIETNVVPSRMDTQAVHDRYQDLQRVEQDFRMIKTGLLEVRPIFVRKASRTKGHVLVCLLALKLARELKRRLTAVFGTTETDPHTVTLEEALSALNRLCLQITPIDEKHSLTTIPAPDERQQKILQALQIPWPQAGKCRQVNK
jgi:transposase